MPKAEEKLESLFAKVRTLPKERQQLAVEALSDEERAVLEAELAAAKRGEFASDEAAAEIRDKPWS